MTALARTQTHDLMRVKRDSLGLIAHGLATRIPALGATASIDVVKALHDLLDGADDTARATRTQVQLHLVRVAEQLVAAAVKKEPKESKMLSTEQAAKLMGCSRPYAAMLIDRHVLAGGVISAGGHRRIPERSVVEWIQSQPKPGKRDGDYRAAARTAGMYDIPEKAYVKTVKAGRKQVDA